MNQSITSRTPELALAAQQDGLHRLLLPRPGGRGGLAQRAGRRGQQGQGAAQGVQRTLRRRLLRRGRCGWEGGRAE